MRFRSLGRVVVFAACLGTLATAGPFFAESVHLFLKSGKGTKVKSITGGWPSHSSRYSDTGDWYVWKMIGPSKWKNIVLKMEVGDVDEDVTDWINEAIISPKAFRGGGLVMHEQQSYREATFTQGMPTKITLPAFDTREDTCTDWQIEFSVGGVVGEMPYMKAKEKANRTKCTSNLRMIFNNGGKETRFDVLETEEVQTILLEADLDGDGEFEPLGMSVGNVVIYVPAVQAGYFQDWMQRATENPAGEMQSGHLAIQTNKMGSIDARFDGMQPISVTKMGDGSVRVEFHTAKEQLKAKPRN